MVDKCRKILKTIPSIDAIVLMNINWNQIKANSQLNEENCIFLKPQFRSYNISKEIQIIRFL